MTFMLYFCAILLENKARMPLISKTPQLSLYSFISKNTYIPNFLTKKIKKNNKNVTALFDAINQGDASAAIFSHPKCYLYLLYLINQKTISFQTGMTVYVYLLALMQFSDQQPVADGDEEIKKPRSIEMRKLVKNHQLSEEGKNYLQELCVGLKNIGIHLDYKKICKYALSLKEPSAQWLLRVQYQHHSDELADYDKLTRIVLFNIPIFTSQVEPSGYGYYHIPSASIINYIFKSIFKDPILGINTFGSVGLNTLREMHYHGLHPVALYALHVKSNPKTADGFRCGPLVMWLHDIEHLFFGSIFTKKERKILWNRYIPILDKMKQHAIDNNHPQLAERMQMVINLACDFDLAPIPDFLDVENRLMEYVCRTFRRDGSTYLYRTGNNPNAELGQHIEDHVYFTLHQFYYSDTLLNKEEREFLQKLLVQLRTRTQEHRRNPDILDQLESHAKIGIFPTPQKIVPSMHSLFHTKNKTLESITPTATVSPP